MASVQKLPKRHASGNGNALFDLGTAIDQFLDEIGGPTSLDDVLSHSNVASLMFGEEQEEPRDHHAQLHPTAGPRRQ